MADETYDPFKTDSGLPDDFDGCIVSGEFKFHDTLTEFNTSPPQPQVGFEAKIQSDDPEIGDGGEATVWFKAGKPDQWAPADNGARLERIDGKKVNYNGATHMGLMVDSLPEIEAPFRERYAETGKGPMDADFWLGLNAHWQRITQKGGGEVKDYQKLLPTKFYDWAGGVSNNGQGASVTQMPVQTIQTTNPSAAPAPAAPAPSSKGEAAPVAASGGELIKGVSREVWDGLFQLAYNAPDFPTFVQAATQALPDTPENQAVITDQSNDSVWELAVAKWKADQGK